MRSGLTFALAAALLFGVSGVVAVDAFDSVTPVQMTQFRSVTAAMILGALAYHRRQTMTGGNLPALAGLGVLLSTVTITFYEAVNRLGVGPGVTLQFLGPALVLIWMRLVQRRSVPAAAWTAAGIALVGTALMNQAWNIDQADPIGVAAGLGAAVAFAGYLILGEHLGKRLPSLTVTAYGFATAALIWVVAVPPRIPQIDGVVWGQLVWVAIAGTTVPFLLEMVALRRADPGAVGVVATAEPIVAAIAAWMALGERLRAVQIVGGLLVVAGIATVQYVTNNVAPDIPELTV
jgi:drug/metabolite transporter (DMT)-like permease